MGIRTEYQHGQFCWVDLMAHDTAAAKSFYGELLGWEAADQDTQGGPPYTIFMIDGRQVAGMGGMTDEMKSSGMPPIWNSYINVDDIAAATSRATELGGNIMMPPMQVVEAGHMAIISDPTGAAVSLWQKLEHFGAQLVNQTGCWGWNELMTDNVESASEFYGDMFGWGCEQEESAQPPYWTFKQGETLLGGMLQKLPEMGEIPNHWSVYFSVDDINAKTEQLTSLGGTVYRPPFEVSVGHISVVSDPQGAVFNIIQMTVPPDE